MFTQTVAGLVHEGRINDPNREIRLTIPNKTPIDLVTVEYDVDIGPLTPGPRYQLDFISVDTKYRNGVLGTTFMTNLGNYIFRNGQPGDFADTITKFPFKGPSATKLHVKLTWNARAGIVIWDGIDNQGGLATISSRDKVIPVRPNGWISVVLGHNTTQYPNEQEAEGIGWKWYNLSITAWAVGEAVGNNEEEDNNEEDNNEEDNNNENGDNYNGPLTIKQRMHRHVRNLSKLINQLPD